MSKIQFIYPISPTPRPAVKTEEHMAKLSKTEWETLYVIVMDIYKKSQNL